MSHLLRAIQITGNPKKGIAPIIPVHRATWAKWFKEGRTPPAVYLPGCATPFWKSDDIEVFIQRLPTDTH